MNIYYTYLWLREDGTPYYVGKGTRYRAFIHHGRISRPSLKERILLEPHISEAAALEAEIFLISYYGREDLGTGPLLNLTTGGETPEVSFLSRQKQSEAKKNCIGIKNNFFGHKHTLESREKQRLAKLGTKQTPETIAKRVAKLRGNHSNLGTKASPQTRAKLSAIRMGRPVSEATRRKIGDATRRRWGNGMPADLIKKLSESHKGKPWTAKQRAAHESKKRT